MPSTNLTEESKIPTYSEKMQFLFLHLFVWFVTMMDGVCLELYEHSKTFIC